MKTQMEMYMVISLKEVMRIGSIGKGLPFLSKHWYHQLGLRISVGLEVIFSHFLSTLITTPKSPSSSFGVALAVAPSSKPDVVSFH